MKGIATFAFSILLASAFAQTSPTAHVLASPKASEPRTLPISWVSFEDPAEHAFSMKVPKDWKVVGGLYRFGPLDPRVMIDLVSPDGKTNIRYGDAHVPPFAVPTPLSIK